jgi:hypothetical protein
MVYSYFVEKLARQSFANVQNHNYDEVLKALAPNVTHRVLAFRCPIPRRSKAAGSGVR